MKKKPMPYGKGGPMKMPKGPHLMPDGELMGGKAKKGGKKK